MIDDQPTLFSPSQVNDYVKAMLEHDSNLNDIWIEGEITQLKHYKLGGQVYFYLSDGQSQINCVMYASFLDNLGFEPKEGVKVRARGKVKVFHKRGSYNFQVSFMMEDGAGKLALQFEALKKKLLEEGVFDPERKKPIPQFPKKIGVITSLDSAAMVDFCRVMSLYAPQIGVTIIPAVMQGKDCPPSVFQAITLAEAYGQFDVLVITRGGGSNEDLAGFNDEVLIRRVFDCPIPVVSAIGHEVDVTLMDFVADLRAQTPTEAAQIISAPLANSLHCLKDLHSRFSTSIQRHVDTAYGRIFDSFRDMGVAMDMKLEKVEVGLTQLKHRLEMANPLHQLERGFSICSRSDSTETLTSIEDVSEGHELKTQLVDGLIYSKVDRIEERKLS